MQQPQSEPTFSEKMEMTRNLMVFPALTVMVLLRNNLGYRLLNPLHIFSMALLLFVLGTLATNTPNHEALQLFGGLVFVFGFGQRFRRWIDYRRGLILHSYYVGDSIFESKRMPMFLRRNRRFTRIVDPLLCVIGGICLLGFCAPLGMWLIFSGFALRTVEDTVYRKSQNRDLDIIDAVIVSEVEAEKVEKFTRTSDPRRAQVIVEDAVPTGPGPDIEEQIKRRSAKRKT